MSRWRLTDRREEADGASPRLHAIDGGHEDEGDPYGELTPEQLAGLHRLRMQLAQRDQRRRRYRRRRYLRWRRQRLLLRLLAVERDLEDAVEGQASLNAEERERLLERLAANGQKLFS